MMMSSCTLDVLYCIVIIGGTFYSIVTHCCVLSCTYFIALSAALKWDKFKILAHSMGEYSIKLYPSVPNAPA